MLTMVRGRALLILEVRGLSSRSRSASLTNMGAQRYYALRCLLYIKKLMLHANLVQDYVIEPLKSLLGKFSGLKLVRFQEWPISFWAEIDWLFDKMLVCLFVLTGITSKYCVLRVRNCSDGNSSDFPCPFSTLCVNNEIVILRCLI